MGLAPGSIFAGRYEIVGELGKGGMGSVYRAIHRDLRREVALKILDAPLAAGELTDDGAARFEREARALAQLDHASIVRITDYGRTRRHHFIAMQLLDGPSLGQLMRHQGKLAPSRALQITRHLLSALVHAHARGVLHRDLKPDNVMLMGTPRPRGSRPPVDGIPRTQTLLGLAATRMVATTVVTGGTIEMPAIKNVALGSGPHEVDLELEAHPAVRAVLIDFGLAHVHDEAALTARGACVGSPSYLAPERLNGVTPDARADLYALGVILYEMLTGARPFSGDSVGEILLAVRTQPARPIRAIRPELSRPLEAFVLKALAKDPARRFQSAEQMLEALEEVRVLEQREVDAAITKDESAETYLELPLVEPSRWSRVWSWLRFGRWRWRDRPEA
jgi:serine/threonine protein kinase